LIDSEVTAKTFVSAQAQLSITFAMAVIHLSVVLTIAVLLGHRASGWMRPNSEAFSNTSALPRVQEHFYHILMKQLTK